MTWRLLPIFCSRWSRSKNGLLNSEIMRSWQPNDNDPLGISSEVSAGWSFDRLRIGDGESRPNVDQMTCSQSIVPTTLISGGLVDQV
jgi:hypothetical protein